MKFFESRLFRKTDGVRFEDAWIKGQNGLDVVVHRGLAISPPNEAFYIHYNQVDHNRVIDGSRIFELIDLTGSFKHDHYLVLLTPDVGALQIPVGVYHRSFSCPSGSILLNQPVRGPQYDERTEFVPAQVGANPALQSVLKRNTPQYVNGNQGEIDQLLVEWAVYPIRGKKSRT